MKKACYIEASLASERRAKWSVRVCRINQTVSRKELKAMSLERPGLIDCLRLLGRKRVEGEGGWKEREESRRTGSSIALHLFEHGLGQTS